MNLVETADLIRGRRDLKTPGRRVGTGGRGPGFGRPQAALGQTQRVPPEAQSLQGDQGDGESSGDGQPPAPWGQGPQKRRRPHGNALRSSSK